MLATFHWLPSPGYNLKPLVWRTGSVFFFFTSHSCFLRHTAELLRLCFFLCKEIRATWPAKTSEKQTQLPDIKAAALRADNNFLSVLSLAPLPSDAARKAPSGSGSRDSEPFGIVFGPQRVVDSAPPVKALSHMAHLSKLSV